MVAKTAAAAMAFDMEQEVCVSEQELASLVANYLEKRCLKKTLAKFLKEAKLVDGFERSEEDLEAIYNSYIFANKSEPCKKTKAKKDFLEPPQKKTKVAAKSSCDKLSEADKIEAKNGGDVDSGLVVQTEPVKIESSLAVESAIGSQEPIKVKKKTKKAKGALIDSILPQDRHSQIDEDGAYQVLNGSTCDAVESISKGRFAEDNDHALNEEHAITCKEPKVKKMKVENSSSTDVIDEIENRKHSTGKKISQNLDCSNKHSEESAVAKSKICDKEKGRLERKQKHKKAVEYVEKVELSSGKMVAQPSSDDDRKGKKVTSTTKDALLSSKSFNGVPNLNAGLDGNVLLEARKGSDSKKKSDFNSHPGRNGLVEADTDDGKHSEGPPFVTPDGVSKLKRVKNGEDAGVRAFQRVKLEEVDFADPRLKNNSYWAKDGAEIGWGAKAEEVLGQVKGRDFRHEKTKKKRGSYKGGAIDLNSHSIKFNYTDED